MHHLGKVSSDSGRGVSWAPGTSVLSGFCPGWVGFLITWTVPRRLVRSIARFMSLSYGNVCFMTLEDIQVDDHLNYIEILVAILDQKTKNLEEQGY